MYRHWTNTLLPPCNPVSLLTLKLCRLFFPLPPSIEGTYITPSNELEREAYWNAAVISPLAGTTHMTSDVTPSGFPHIEDDAVTKAPSVSTIGPSISQVGTTSGMRTDQPRVVFIAESPVVIDALVTGASADLPVQAAETIPSGRIVTGMGTEGWTERSTSMDNLTIEFTNPLELREEDPLQTDRYMGAYPDFHLPTNGHPRISEVFYANTQLISNDNFPLTLIHIPEWEREYHTAMFGVDRGNGIVYAVY